MGTFANYFFILYNYTAHKGIGLCISNALFCKFQSTEHIKAVVKIFYIHKISYKKRAHVGLKNLILSSFIQTILSVLELHQFSLRSRTLPPVRNCTSPWRVLFTYKFIISLDYKMSRKEKSFSWLGTFNNCKDIF